MKILQIINSLQSGGAEKLIVDTCTKYSELGVQVDVLLLDGTRTPFYDMLDTVKGINIFSTKKGSNIYNPLHVFEIIKYLKNYDVIHVHLFPALYWVAIANIFSLKKYNLIITEHNTTNRRRKLWLFKTLDRIIYRQYKKLITISNAVDESLKLHLGPTFNHFIKIYNGIDLETIEKAEPYTKTELGFTNNDKLIIQVASFTPQKDQKTLIRAMGILPTDHKLILVGQGTLENEHKNLVEKLELSDRVFFYGVRKDVPRLLKSVDIVVLSSFYEGLSLSSIEGMASGKPFIASDAPGLREVVEGSGVLFKIEDYNNLAKIIKELINDKSYYEDVSNKCIGKSYQFDINLMVKSYIDLYISINNKKKSRRI